MCVYISLYFTRLYSFRVSNWLLSSESMMLVNDDRNVVERWHIVVHVPRLFLLVPKLLLLIVPHLWQLGHGQCDDNVLWWNSSHVSSTWLLFRWSHLRGGICWHLDRWLEMGSLVVWLLALDLCCFDHILHYSVCSLMALSCCCLFCFVLLCWLSWNCSLFQQLSHDCIKNKLRHAGQMRRFVKVLKDSMLAPRSQSFCHKRCTHNSLKCVREAQVPCNWSNHWI